MRRPDLKRLPRSRSRLKDLSGERGTIRVVVDFDENAGFPGSHGIVYSTHRRVFGYAISDSRIHKGEICMRLFPIFLIAAGISLAADKTVDSIKAAEKSWAAATVAGDENALGRIL